MIVIRIILSSLTAVTPEIMSHSDDIEVRRGNTITLRCVARGHPVPTVTWLKDNRVLGSNSRISQPTVNSLKVFIIHSDICNSLNC